LAVPTLNSHDSGSAEPGCDLFDVIDDADANAALQAVWGASIRYHDTSPWYGRGQSEHRLGAALYRLRTQATRRLRYFTKVARLFRALHDAEDFEQPELQLRFD
jgi:D-threo-aldose 1-dehydrogenase